MSFYANNKFLLKNKIRSGVSFFNFFLCSNSFDFTSCINFSNINFNNKSFFLNSFSQFNLSGFFYKSPFYYYDLKTTFSLGLNFIDFINLDKFFLEEASSFNNCKAGAWKAGNIYNNNVFNITTNFKNFFSNGFGIINFFIFLFNKIALFKIYARLLYSFFFNLFFFLIYFLK